MRSVRLSAGCGHALPRRGGAAAAPAPGPWRGRCGSATRTCGSRAPQLYPVPATALLRRRASSRYDTDIGIRSIRVVSGRLLLNGRLVQLRGASMHENASPDHGMALTPQRLEQGVELLHDLGATLTAPTRCTRSRSSFATGSGSWCGPQVPTGRLFGETAPPAPESPDDSVVRSRWCARKPSVRALGHRARPEPPGRLHLERGERAQPAPWPDRAQLLRPTPCASTTRSTRPVARRRRRSRRLSLSSCRSPDDLRPVRRDRPEQLLRLVPGPERLPRRPHRAGAVPAPDARLLPAFGALHHGVRRSANRVGPLKSTRKGCYAFQRTCSATTSTHTSATTSSSTGRSSGSCVTSASSPAGTEATRSPRSCQHGGLVDENGNRKPAFFELARRFHATPPFR